MRALSAMFASVLIAACAGGNVPPAWQSDAHGALAAYRDSYLTGRTRPAEIEFARMRDAVASTGRADLVARVELVRCALRTASLEFDDCPGFRVHADDAGAAERAYAAYLAGRWGEVDASRLPAPHRAVVAGGEAALAATTDPLARIVAAGTLFRAGKISPTGIAAAVDAASSQGWRRPLAAWLGVQETRARAAGDLDAAARIRRRIEMVAPRPTSP